MSRITTAASGLECHGSAVWQLVSVPNPAATWVHEGESGQDTSLVGFSVSVLVML